MLAKNRLKRAVYMLELAANRALQLGIDSPQVVYRISVWTIEFGVNLMANKYIAPELGKTAFNCPHCNAFARQDWYIGIQGEQNLRSVNPNLIQAITDARGKGIVDCVKELYNLQISICFNCGQFALWVRTYTHDSQYWNLVHPAIMTAPLPSDDMPEDVKQDYLEASEIARQSPRGAAALLRLALQKLMLHLDESGKNINNDIASLVKKGVLDELQQALDSVRVIGNEAVHPGVLDLKDDTATVNALFDLLNIIVDSTIGKKRKIAAVYSILPPGKVAEIKARDGKP
jgi:hypothetical protein